MNLYWGMIIIFGASVIQAATGFGFSILATPFLLLLFNSRDAIEINMFISIFISVIMAFKVWREADGKLLGRLILGGLLGAPAGGVLFASLDIGMLKVIIGVVILAMTVGLSIKYSGSNGNLTAEGEGRSPEGSVILKEKKELSRYNEVLVGVASGFLTTSIGMPGPPMLLYLSWKGVKKEVLRATSIVYCIFIYPLSIVSQAFAVKTGRDVIYFSLAFIPAAILGIVVGALLFKLISQRVFQIITQSILIFTGIYMLAATIKF